MLALGMHQHDSQLVKMEPFAVKGDQPPPPPPDPNHPLGQHPLDQHPLPDIPQGDVQQDGKGNQDDKEKADNQPLNKGADEMEGVEEEKPVPVVYSTNQLQFFFGLSLVTGFVFMMLIDQCGGGHSHSHISGAFTTSVVGTGCGFVSWVACKVGW